MHDCKADVSAGWSSRSPPLQGESLGLHSAANGDNGDNVTWIGGAASSSGLRSGPTAELCGWTAMWNSFDVSFQDEEDDAVRCTAERLEMGPDEGAEPGQTVAHHCADIDVRLFWLLLPAVATCASHLARWAVGTPYCVSRVGIWIKSHHGLPGRLLLSLRRPLLAGVGRWY